MNFPHMLYGGDYNPDQWPNGPRDLARRCAPDAESRGQPGFAGHFFLIQTETAAGYFKFRVTRSVDGFTPCSRHSG